MPGNESANTRAPRLPALVSDIQLQPCKRGCLFGVKPLDRGKPLHWRQTWIDQRDAALDVGDNARFSRGQKRCEVTCDRGNLAGNLGPVGGIKQLSLSGAHAAKCLTRTWLLSCCGSVGGLSGFRGFLARPFQVTRYWSRSQPLSLSRSSK